MSIASFACSSSQSASQADPPLVVIVEDEADVANALKRVIEASGSYQVRVLLSAGEIESVISQTRPCLVFTDLMMPDIDGFDVVRRIKGIEPYLPVVVVSAYSTIENAVAAVKKGAFDFLAKPFRPESVELILAKALREHRLLEQVHRARGRDPDLMAIQGDSVAMNRLREWVLRVRDVRASVLIEGESGTGKELVARALHAGKGPFVAVNMATVADSLAESELFGHRKGAFTGATGDRKGLLLEANGGTLFLDEINAASAATQARLLRVLQERKVRPLGATTEIPVDFRLISASNQPLDELVQQGHFRRDLLHRINTLSVRVPPLRERRDDIPVLVEYFLARYSRAHNRSARAVSAAAMAAFVGGNWPGNVRELENAVEQSVILSPERASEIELDALPPSLGGQGWMFEEASEPVGSTERARTLADVELHYILAVLRQAGGNKAEASRILGIGYKTLLRKLASLDGA
ncbi:MAG: sigma-54-dependent transcriptional regulator [Hyphomicrobiaceae bacterium]